VSLPGLYAYGHGIEIPALRRLQALAVTAAGGFAAADRSRPPLQWWRAASRRGLPGGVLAAGTSGPPHLLPPATSTTIPPDARARGHDLRPREPDQDPRHHRVRHGPGGRRTPRPGAAGPRFPSRLSGRGQGPGHGLPPPEPLLGPGLVGAPLQGAVGTRGL
jgi:hypothetical protein